MIRLVEPIEEYEKLANYWYKQPEIKFEILNAVKFRESVLLAKNRKLTHRCLKINAVRFLDKTFERYHVFENDYLYNFYNSIARFPDLPMFSFNWDEKMEQQREFNRNFRQYLTAYDLVFDLDNPDMGLVYSSATALKKVLDDWKIQYWLKFSGTKGFHFTIDYYDLPEKLKALDFDDLCYMFKLFAHELKIMEKIPDIDQSIYDLRRIIKTAYSVVYPYYYIALPLSDEQFSHFRLRDVHISNLSNQTRSMRQRGLLKRHTDCDRDNLLKLMRYIANKSAKDAELFLLMKSDKEFLITFMKKHNLV